MFGCDSEVLGADVQISDPSVPVSVMCTYSQCRLYATASANMAWDGCSKSGP